MVHPTSKAFDALTRSRLDKDLQELQHMIAQHFEQRKKDDVELDSLVSRIERRKTERGQQMKMRKERDREIQERNAKEKVEREAERKRKADEAEEKKRIQMESVKNYTGYLGQKRNKGNKRITEREKKRKVLLVVENSDFWSFSIIFLPFSVISSFYGHFQLFCGHFQASFNFIFTAH